jgi:hypothetical protein
LVQIKPSNNLYFILENQTSSEMNPMGTPNIELEYIRVGTIANPTGLGILDYAQSSFQTSNFKSSNFGSYKKIYTMKLIQLYLALSLLYLINTHFLSHKFKISIWSNELHMKQE